jgi:UDP-N-acetylmuramate--alanine ligase
VAEVDESDGSLVLFTPEVAVVTNIECDHLDHYGDLDRIVDAFGRYTRQSRCVVGCLDCPTVRSRLAVDISYSLDGHPDANYTAREAVFDGTGTRAQV